jgi:hypothetical protein
MLNLRKKEALNSFFFSVLWIFNENSDKITDRNVTRVLSKGIILSETLIKLLETKLDKTDDIKYILFVLSSYIRDWLYKYPRAFTGLEIDDLIYLIEKGERLFVGNIVITLFCIESELEKIKETEPEFIYKRTVTKFEKIKLQVKEILEKNRWQMFVENNSLNILDMNDKTIGSTQLANILSQNDVNSLGLFIQRHLT